MYSENVFKGLNWGLYDVLDLKKKGDYIYEENEYA